MQIRLQEGLFEASTCEVKIRPNEMCLFIGREPRDAIPFAQMRYFNLEGSGNHLCRFRLETVKKTYEGLFLTEQDAAEFLAVLRKRTECYLDLRLDIQPKKER